MQGLQLIASTMPENTIARSYPPFVCANRGVMEFFDHEVRDQYLAWYHALPMDQRVYFHGQVLSPVRQKSQHDRRKAASTSEAAKIVQEQFLAGEVIPVPGRFAGVARGITVAQMDRATELMAYDWHALASMLAKPQLQALRQALE